ncbi:cyclopropane-fatty-acyl-phospholipid synthase [Actinacidiphila yanglinensis]|uniref:Cyclopropane-fatty-acyl-phospholipid synthase n=1 Tax=Actinacidiphila yanglinensis TaxID=310779 RepID=A0A1H6E7I1_9ACTN|nr:cyclopropane-fatty-acyl-phospholipid synthase family protein [Actinacidiphila yanglinensis]SEG93637.1 cyclopropane-fatty-acyl-phospholipid synthase [Actinacidiphila yanglinensis]
MADAAHRILELADHALSSPFPLRVRAWDGSETGPAGAPVLVFRKRRALRRLLWRPGELGLARAWVAGDLDVDGDLYTALDTLSGLIWERGESDPAAGRAENVRQAVAALRNPVTYRLARSVLSLAGPGLPPAPPPEEVRRRTGIAHTKRRDKEAISHHYDVGNAFYEIVLGPSMVYSCALWGDAEGASDAVADAVVEDATAARARAADAATASAAAHRSVEGTDPVGAAEVTLEQAQYAKLDLVCRKLGLREGQRLLDVGCGWGSMALHAAGHYGVRVTGVTLSVEQAAFARKRIAEAGLTDRIEIRVQDYRDVRDGPYDAISSIGMAEHVGSERYLEYARTLYALLRPGGRLLNHQIARRPLRQEEEYRVDEFIDRYVFPDGELSPVGTTVGRLEEAGFEVRDVEALREHYGRTLRSWVANLEAHWKEAVAATSAGRARVWRLYMAASALSFERNHIGVNQVMAVRTDPAGRAGLPATRSGWLS